MTNRTLLPNDIRDSISIVGIFSAIALFWKFFLQKQFFIEADAVFFIIMGVGLLITGKVFTFPKWIKDGIQRNEYLFLFSLIIGSFGLIAGVLIAFGLTLPANISSIAGVVALFVGLIIVIDYWKKNT